MSIYFRFRVRIPHKNGRTDSLSCTLAWQICNRVPCKFTGVQAEEAGDIRDLLAADGDGDGGGGERNYVDLYWTDAAERRGVVYLYGLVRAPCDSEGGGPAYQSCCAAVLNNRRTLYVLPRIRPGAFCGAFLPLIDLVERRVRPFRPIKPS